MTPPSPSEPCPSPEPPTTTQWRGPLDNPPARSSGLRCRWGIDFLMSPAGPLHRGQMDWVRYSRGLAARLVLLAARLPRLGAQLGTPFRTQLAAAYPRRVSPWLPRLFLPSAIPSRANTDIGDAGSDAARAYRSSRRSRRATRKIVDRPRRVAPPARPTAPPPSGPSHDSAKLVIARDPRSRTGRPSSPFRFRPPSVRRATSSSTSCPGRSASPVFLPPKTQTTSQR